MQSISKFKSKFQIEFLARVVSVISGGLLMLILARQLGTNGYGLLFLSISILSSFQFFSKFGIEKSAARYISNYKTNKQSQIKYIIRFSLIFILVTILASSIIIYHFNSSIVGVFEEPELSPFLYLGILYLIFGTLVKYMRTVLQGFEAIQFSSAIHMVDRGGRLILCSILVFLGFGAIGALGGYIISFTIASIIGSWMVYRLVSQYDNGGHSVEKGLRRRIVEYSAPLALTNTANFLEHRVDTILIGFFLNPTAVAYYTLAEQITQFVRTPVDALGFTISPTFGAMKSEGNIEEASALYESAINNSLLIYIPAAVGIVVVAEPMVEIVFGAEYAGAIIVIQIFSLYLVFQSVTMVTSNSLDYLGRARARSIVKSITSLSNFLLNLILIPWIGVIGAAVATVLTYFFYTIANIAIILSELNLEHNQIIKIIFYSLAISFVMGVVVKGFLSITEGILPLLGGICLGITIWAIACEFLGLIKIKDTLKGHIPI